MGEATQRAIRSADFDHVFFTLFQENVNITDGSRRTGSFTFTRLLPGWLSSATAV